VGLLNPKSGKVRFIIEDAGNASYSPSGHLLFTRGDVLLAAPFDLSRLETTASPVPILSGLLTRFTTEPAVFQLADNGTLLYTPGGRTFSARRLAIVDAGGNVKPWSDERRPFLLDPSVSRDGRRFACVITNAQGIDEIWVSDVDRPALRRVVAIPDADCDFVALSPDGEWIAFARTGRNEKDGIYVQRADGQGSDRRVVKLPDPSAFEGPQCWTPDGASLVIADIVGGRSHLRLVPSVLTAEHEVQPTPLVRGFVGEFQGALSPDGHTLAFASNESGKNEVYACAYRADGTVSDPVRVSSGGGSAPHWSLDGKTLLYLADQSRLMSATVSTAPALTAGAPIQKLDLGKLRIASFAVLPEGRLLGVLQGEDERDEVTGGNVVLNFSDELERKVGRRRR
jgi:dipeptidyl aminopeptidase/acylaminoacyl peptidase